MHWLVKPSSTFFLGGTPGAVIEIDGTPAGGGFFRETPTKLDDDKVIMAVINKFLYMVNKDD